MSKGFFGKINAYFLKSHFFKRIFISMAGMVGLSVTILGIVNYSYIRSVFEEEAKWKNMQLVAEINRDLEEELQHMDLMIDTFYAYFADTDLLVSRQFANDHDEHLQNQKVNRYYQQLQMMYPDLYNLYLYVSPQKFFSFSKDGINLNNYNPEGEDWFLETVANGANTTIHGTHIPYQLKSKRQVISFSQRLYDIYSWKSVLRPVILIDFDAAAFFEQLSEEGLESTELLILDQNDTLLYGTIKEPEEVLRKLDDRKDETTLFSVEYLDRQYMIVTAESNIAGWKIITLTDTITLVEKNYHMLQRLFWNGLIVSVFLFVLAFKLTSYLTKSVALLQAGMREIRRGRFDILLPENKKDEMGMLLHDFNRMASKIDQLIQEKCEQEIAAKEAELKFLQAQINPHFVYNTMQMIGGIALVNDVPSISEIVQIFSKLLRYCLNEQQMVTLKEELNHVRGYLQIHEVRFAEYLTVHYTVNEELLSITVPKLILQPIVENIMQYAFRMKRDNWEIQIAVEEKNNGICVRIEDNGCGIDKDELIRIRAHITMDVYNNSNVKNSIGMRNIHQRIMKQYGKPYGLEIESEIGCYTRVQIHLPKGV